jgi:hypothetical protein
MRRIGLGLACLLAAGMCRAEGLFLAAGETLTILDTADPQTRVVLQAPPDAPLDLGSILVAGPDESVHSIVTRIQVNAAGGMKEQADGTVTLSGSEPGSARVLRSGVLFRSGTKFVYHAVRPPAPGGPSLAPGAARKSGQVIIAKRGGTSAEAQRDIASCRQYASQAVLNSYSPGPRIDAHNAALISCLRGFGYEVQTP